MKKYENWIMEMSQSKVNEYFPDFELEKKRTPRVLRVATFILLLVSIKPQQQSFCHCFFIYSRNFF